MKILSVNNAYYVRGGADKYFFDLNALLESRGEEVISFSVKDSNNLPSDFERFFLSHADFFGRGRKMSDYLKITARAFYSLEARRKIRALISAAKPQIAHIHQIHHNISPSILPVFKENGIPVIHTLFNYDLICPNYTLFFDGRVCQDCADGIYLRAALRRCHKGLFAASALASLKSYFQKVTKIYEKNIDFFITPSRFLEKILIRNGFEEKKFVCIRPFVDAAGYKPSYKDEGYFAYIGRLVEGKGLHTLLEAMRKLKGVKLYLAGDGYLKETLQRDVKKYDLNNVKFLGFQRAGELKNILSGAMFTVLPSEAYETFGMALIESFAAGKPVIGSDLGPIPEIIDNGANGLLFRPGDVDSLGENIRRLIDRPQLRRDMGANARKKAEDLFSPARHYREIKNLYNSFNAGSGQLWSGN